MLPKFGGLRTRGSSLCSRRIECPPQRNFSAISSTTRGSCACRTFSSRPTLPDGLWDSHVHIIEPNKYPLPPGTKPPQEATMDQALSNSEQLGLPNMVLVQISTYGNDNTWILEGLKEVGPARGRGVVAFDPDNIDMETLHQWHRLGVRGVRLNLRSTKTTLGKEQIQTALRRYAEKLRPMKTWSIGLYADMDVLDHVQPLISELGVKIVLEHFGSPSILPLNPAKQSGWTAMKTMMEDPLVYVKISAPYLFSNDPEFKDFESLAKALFSMRNGNGVVFGSDWPHTKSRGYDAKPFMDKVIEWCDGDKDLLRKLFRDNAKVLWDI
ncbi:related to TIM barrel metal-dependent hydrolase [Fusarium torulosum]|uniref:Related to TIM barrel metal-dependent hydrolase n=1 Tax=Fusarium torulosum TaxID=33205 RepID=A0AAE8MCN0_9HYPO|nr:related to TIM barrel metal-dependent hydrolase [Fusarium torulosum]